ncbi:motility associated factor glycosyltransferase family protein [Persephonella sp.]
MLNKDYLRKNLELLKKVNPKILNRLLEKLPEIEKNLEIILKENDFDILFHGNRIENVVEKARKKIEDREKTIGVIWTHTMRVNFPEKLVRYADNLSPPKEKLIYNTEGLIIFGTLPFFHIKELLENKQKFFPNLKQVIIYEPHLELVYLFLLSVDLEKLARESKINLTFSINQETLNKHMLLYFSMFSFVSYLKSYEDNHIKQLEAYMKNLYEMKTVTIPYEAAYNRVKFFKKTIKGKNNRYLLNIKTKNFFEKNKIPFIIVGSGPSLDKDIELLKSIQNRGILISLTTATRTLVKNGIIPDFTVIADAQSNMVRFIKDIDEDILKKVYVFAPIFTDPEFNRRFKETLIFNYGMFKDLLNIRDQIKVKVESGATVLNTLFSLLINLRTNNFFLFGVDFGTKYKDRFHTEGYTDKEGDLEVLKDATIEVEGNYGGVVYSRKDYYISKKIFETQIKTGKKRIKNLKVYNLSDGAKIEGSITIAKSEIDRILPRKFDKKSVVKRIRNNFDKVNLHIQNSEVEKIRTKIIPKITETIGLIKKENSPHRVISILEEFSFWGIYLDYLTDILFNQEEFAKIQTIIKILKLASEEDKEKIIKEYRDYIISVLSNIKAIPEEIIN